MNKSTEAGQINVLLLSTYPHGGAGGACRRLHDALMSQQVHSNLLYRHDVGGQFNFIAERISFLPWERDKSVRFAFSLANFGTDISRHPAVAAADVLHLHWWNQGFLSLKGLAALGKLQKKIVWTLHDMWAFTGGCHYDGDCGRFEQACGHCPRLRFQYDHDLSNKIWQRKREYYPRDMEIVACSKWLADKARSSSLLRDFSITNIPNPIDIEQFKPTAPEARTAFRAKIGAKPGQKLVLFAAMNINNPLKGFTYFKEAMQALKAEKPGQDLAVVVVGKGAAADFSDIPFPILHLGLIKDPNDMAQVYAACDVFVIPSLEENLPNTIMESLACGTPAVGFEVGGIPEMIDHDINGKVTAFKNSRQMAADIAWVLEDESRRVAFSKAAREKVLREYAPSSVVNRYLKVYQR